MKDNTIRIMRLLHGSWCRPARIEASVKWASHKDNREDIMNEFDADSDEDYEDKFDDFLNDDDSRTILLLMYLYDKGKLTDEDIKELIAGEYGSSCYGDWRKDVEKLWGITFTK